jgi:hypothetical protein
VFSTGPIAATTYLIKTSMAAPLGVATGGSGSGYHLVARSQW